jgi:hypothetical protein
MMETETVTVTATYFDDVEYSNQSGESRFGPLASRAKAEDVLQTLAGRADVKKATLIREIES